jgi:hypothetical protein
VTSIDSSLLLGFYQARTGQSTLATGSSYTGKTKYAPTAPWATNSGAPRASALVETVMQGRRFIDENAATLDLPGASADYKKLFSLFQGLNALTGLAERMGQRGVTDAEKTKIEKLFTKGLTETVAYADSVKMEGIRLTRGEAMLSDKTKVGVPRANYTYTTATVHEGNSTEAVPQFAGAASFTISVKKLSGTQNINIDLSEMTGTRSMSSVATFINSKLSDAGVISRFSTSRTPGEPKVVTTGNTKVTLPATSDKFAFKITGDSAEAVTFSAPAATPAVYVATTAGNPDPDKDKTTDDAVYASSMIKTGAATTPGGVGTRVFANGLAKTVTGVKDSQVGADGSVYMLAEVKGDIDGQAIKGATDIALLKYDSQGQLLYTRTLGAVGTVKANALTVSDDGKVAIAGSITGQMEGTTNGPINSGPTSSLSDSFVTLYDAKGDEVWTQRRGALQADEATAVAFGADGTVYVGGKTRSNMAGATGAAGGWDGYLTGITTSAKGIPVTQFTSSSARPRTRRSKAWWSTDRRSSSPAWKTSTRCCAASTSPAACPWPAPPVTSATLRAEPSPASSWMAVSSISAAPAATPPWPSEPRPAPTPVVWMASRPVCRQTSPAPRPTPWPTTAAARTTRSPAWPWRTARSG